MVLRKSFYIRWSAGRSPRVHEVNPGQDPSHLIRLCFKLSILMTIVPTTPHRAVESLKRSGRSHL